MYTKVYTYICQMSELKYIYRCAFSAGENCLFARFFFFIKEVVEIVLMEKKLIKSGITTVDVHFMHQRIL